MVEIILIPRPSRILSIRPLPPKVPIIPFRDFKTSVASDNIELGGSRAKITPDPERYSQDSDDDMVVNRPPMHRPTDGRSQQPLLKDDREGRPSRSSFGNDAEGHSMLHHTRRPTIRSKSPEYDAAQATRKKYMIASGFLLLSLASFVVQTETAVYIQHELGWDKPYCML